MAYAYPRRINLSIDQRINNQITSLYKLMKREGRQVFVTVTVRRKPNFEIVSKSLEIELSIPGGTPRTVATLGYRIADNGEVVGFAETGAGFVMPD